MPNEKKIKRRELATPLVQRKTPFEYEQTTESSHASVTVISETTVSTQIQTKRPETISSTLKTMRA